MTTRKHEQLSLLGTHIERHLRKTGKSIAAIAREVGLTPERVRQLMVFPRPPRVEVALRFAKLLGIDESEVLKIASDTNLYAMPADSEYAVACDAPKVSDSAQYYEALTKSITAMQSVLTEMGRRLYELKNNIDTVVDNSGSSRQQHPARKPRGRNKA